MIMSRKHADTWRPHTKKTSNYNWTPANHNDNLRSQKDWNDINNRLDDQIAPKHISDTTEDLQRWVTATADFPQQGHRYNEGQIIHRIDHRYGSTKQNPNEPFPRYSHLSIENDRERISEQTLLLFTKRRRSISPPLAGRVPAGLSAVAHLRESKRQRLNTTSSPRSVPHEDLASRNSPKELEEGHDYEQSERVELPRQRRGSRGD